MLARNRFTAPHNRKFEKGVVNFFQVCHTLGAQVRPEKTEPSKSGGSFAFTASPEVVMQPVHQPTKQEQRNLMRELAEQRQRQTPERHDPNWVSLYWLARGVRA